MNTFGEFWEDDDATPEAATPDGGQPMLSDGKHVGKIVVAEVKDLPFKVSDRNKAGTSLVVKVAVSGHQLAEDIVPVQMRGLISSICKSAGIEPPSKGEAFGPFCERLKGQTAPIETTQAVATSGREYVRIKWLPGIDRLPKEIEKRASPPRSRPAKTDSYPDDVPF